MPESLDPVRLDDLESPLPATMSSSLRWRCRPNCIVVEREAPQTSVGQIALPNQAIEEKAIGTVLLSGSPDIIPGETVIWQKYAGIPVPTNDLTLKSSQVIVMVEDILMVGRPRSMDVDPEALLSAIVTAETIGERMQKDFYNPETPDAINARLVSNG